MRFQVIPTSTKGTRYKVNSQYLTHTDACANQDYILLENTVEGGSTADCSFCSTVLPGAVLDLYRHGNFPDLSRLVVLHLSASHNYTMESLHSHFTLTPWRCPEEPLMQFGFLTNTDLRAHFLLKCIQAWRGYVEIFKCSGTDLQINDGKSVSAPTFPGHRNDLNFLRRAKM